MKIVILTKGEENRINTLTPREIRNYCGSITDQKFNEFIMYHGRETPPIAYLRPYNNSAEILLLQNDFYVAQHLVERIEKNKDLYGRKIHKVIIKDDSYVPPFNLGEQTMHYTTRTPIIVCNNEKEYKMKYNFELYGRMDELIRLRIAASMSHQLKCYSGIDRDFNDLKLNFKDFNVVTLQYKEGDRKCGVFANFESNYLLPDLVGYKIGLGYGQLKANQVRTYDKENKNTTIQGVIL
jgi:hypothetical protein